MSRFEDTEPYPNDQTRPRQPDPPTTPAFSLPMPAAAPIAAPQRFRPAQALLGALFVAGSLGLIIVLIVLLTHGSQGKSITMSQPCCVVATSTLAPMQTVPPTVTGTSAPLACSDLAEFRQAGVPATHSSHFALTFPAQMVGYAVATDTEAQGYQHRTVRLCTPQGGVTLADALNASFTRDGWQSLALSDPLASEGVCQVACWAASFTVTGGMAHEVVGLSNVAASGGTQTATLTLTIAPFSAGAFTLDAALPTFNFDPGANAPADVQFVSPQAIMLLDNAVYAVIPTNQIDITYTAIRSLDYTNPGQSITLSTNSQVALQGNLGHFSRVVVTQAQANALTCSWLTYPYGF